MFLVLDSLKMCIGKDRSIVPSIAPVISPIMLSLWQRHMNDPMILDDVIAVFDILASNPHSHPALYTNLLPPISTVLSNPTGHPSGIVETMINLLNVMVVHCEAPLSPDLTGTLLSLLLALIAATPDHSVLQAGAEVPYTYTNIKRFFFAFCFFLFKKSFFLHMLLCK